MDIIREWEFNLTADHVLKAQGSNPDVIKNRKPSIYEIANWAVKEGLPLLDPSVIQKHYFVKGLRHHKLSLMTDQDNSQFDLSGSLISEHLASAEEVLIMACTVGDELEKIAAELMKTDPLYGWALDSFGSVAVESLANQACNRVEAQAYSKGKKTSIPLSPGMLGWTIDQGQQELFSLIDASRIGVFLNNNYQMHPGKSISFVIGLGTNLTKAGVVCDYCAMSTTCRYQNHYN